MKYKVLLVIFLFIYISCSRADEAIELVKASKATPSSEYGSTVIEFIDYLKEHPDISDVIVGNCEWKATSMSNEIYYVGFWDKYTNRGLFWEANVKTGEVRFINDNPLLLDRYHMNEVDDSGQLLIDSVIVNNLVIKEPNYDDDVERYYSKARDKGIIYELRALLKNNSGHNISELYIQCNLVVIYNIDKYFILPIDYYNTSIKLPSFTNDKPLRTGEIVELYIETEPLEKFYKDYQPIAVYCDIMAKASNPISYHYEGHIKRIDVEWPYH